MVYIYLKQVPWAWMIVYVPNINNIYHGINLVSHIRFDLIWVPDPFFALPFLSWSLMVLGSPFSFSWLLVVNILNGGEVPKTKKCRAKLAFCVFFMSNSNVTIPSALTKANLLFLLTEWEIGGNSTTEIMEKKNFVSRRAPGSCATAIAQISVHLFQFKGSTSKQANWFLFWLFPGGDRHWFSDGLKYLRPRFSPKKSLQNR